MNTSRPYLPCIALAAALTVGAQAVADPRLPDLSLETC